MRHVAWLRAVPKAPPGGARKKSDERSRLKRLQDEGIEPELPEVSCPYLLELLYEIGPGFPGAMGEVALPSTEIDAWQRITGVRLDPWEARTIRRLSIEHVRESYAATEPDAPPPWGGSEVDPHLAIVSADLRDDIRRMADL